MKKLKVALLGVCNSNRVLQSMNDKLSVTFYQWKPCYIDMFNPGLNISYKDLYVNILGDKIRDNPFNRKMLYLDLNKTTIQTIESLNPDYIFIDLSSLTFPTYEVTYKGKKACSCGLRLAPYSLEQLRESISGFDFRLVNVSDNECIHAINKLYNYIKANWDINKVILFNYSAPEYYFDKFGDIHKYPYENKVYSQGNTLKFYNKLFMSKLEGVRVFNDPEIKIASPSESEIESEVIPSNFHVSDDTLKLQNLLMDEFLFNTNNRIEIEKLKAGLRFEISKCGRN